MYVPVCAVQLKKRLHQKERRKAENCGKGDRRRRAHCWRLSPRERRGKEKNEGLTTTARTTAARTTSSGRSAESPTTTPSTEGGGGRGARERAVGGGRRFFSIFQASERRERGDFPPQGNVSPCTRTSHIWCWRSQGGEIQSDQKGRLTPIWFQND